MLITGVCTSIFLQSSLYIPASIILVVICLIALIFLFINWKKLRPLKRWGTPQEGLGPKEWELQMAELSRSHKNVKWKKTNFIVGNYNQIAYKRINKIRSDISEATSDVISLIPSARWLFDNFQMLYREIKKVKTTGTNYLSMPVLKSDEYRGYPRVYIIAKKMVEISGGYLHENNIILMIQAYQKECPLTERELAVLPEMLGLCLLERIIEVSKEILHAIHAKTQAEGFVRDKLVEKDGFLDIAPLCVKLDNIGEDIVFHSHVIYLLKNMSVEDKDIERYITSHLSDGSRELTSVKIFKEEGRKETLLESCIRTPITSLRELNQINEEELIEALSVTEQILSKDPDGVYPFMDSSSRGLYRSMVEKLAVRHGLEEIDVARECLKLAETGMEHIYCPHHVGAYLFGRGYSVLKASVLNRPAPVLAKDPRRFSGALYFLTHLFFLTGLVFLLLGAFYLAGYSDEPYRSIVMLIVSAPLLFTASRKITDSITKAIVPVQRLPLMDYSEEIPDSARTFLVMPVILSSKDQGLEYAEKLHKHYLANKQPNLYFALLVDFADAQKKDLPSDDKIRDALITRMEQLNKKYPSTNKRFSLFFRKRLWNESEESYVCWERKRGKLEEFNALLNGVSPEETTFTTLFCDRELLSTIQYVITLDADSDLIKDNAVKLVGTIDHPLNRAFIDPVKKKVTEGYAIIQPIVKNHIYEKNSALFPKVFGGSSGLANYSVVVSDIYQDLFQEGSFVGKGIYNVKAFHRLLYRKIPENSVLSHDLLESCYARTAFASGINIVESFPGSYISYAKREHRWIRGDWQLLPWLFKKELSLLSKWKITDNLISSLIPISKTLFILLNIVLTPAIFWLWVPVVLFQFAFDMIMLILGIILHHIRRPRLALVHSRLVLETSYMVLKAFLDIIFLPAAAFNAMDAIVTTLYRIIFSKKHLLMWNAADNVEKTSQNTLKGYFISLGPSGLTFFILMIFASAFSSRSVLLVAMCGTLAAFWGTAFLTAFFISKSGRAVDKARLDRNGLLYETSRRMWKFFTTFATKENNWLCPDNYQASSSVKVTTKTSPTNIGLQFLSILTARDFGFETLSSTLDYIENLLYTVNVLPKWNGHLYNWYDTRTLEVLQPRYISTVDSGNFYADMIALKNGLLEQRNISILSTALFSELAILAGNTGMESPSCNEKTVGDLLENLTRMQNTMYHEDDDNPAKEELSRMIDLFSQEVESFELHGYGLHDNITLSALTGGGNQAAADMEERITGLCGTIDNMLKNVDFSCLYNKKRMLFHIGYNVSAKLADEGCYDLIASEAMLTSYIAIARGEVPVKHWQKLGRPLTLIQGIPAHVSWSGTMFEYLMPNLLVKEYEGSVFSDSSRAAVIQQMRYANSAGIPWGISESQYHRFDVNSNYQYMAFGVPKLRLQPSYAPPLVVAPYACMLALEYTPDKALDNLEKMKELQAYGEFGFFEALDFNAPDPVHMTGYCIVRSYMAHHHGMSLVAINNYLNDGIMRHRFHAEPTVKAAETLLEEKRQTWFVSISRKGYTVDIRKKTLHEDETLTGRHILSVAPSIPQVGYFSNGSYSTLITSDGDGFSRCGNIMVNRYRPDIYSQTGLYIYIRDIEQKRFWSTAYNPAKVEADDYRVILSHHQAEFKRTDGDLSTYTIVTLSPLHDLEIRKVTLKNYGTESKQVEFTSYLETAVDTYMAESSHPAFNKLFIESEYIQEYTAFISKRRGVGRNTNPYVMHMVRADTEESVRVEYENDRMRFIGRNNTLANPDALTGNMPLTNTSGFSNDPIMSLRVTVNVEPGSDVTITFITGVCESRQEVMKVCDEMSVSYRVDDILEKSRLQSIMELKYLGISSARLNAFQGIISPLFYPSRHFRGPSERIWRNWKDQNSLWRFGISGDKPIMLLEVDSVGEIEIIRDVLKLYEYLRINSVNVDLVILCNAKYGYAQALGDLLNSMTSSLKIYDNKDQPGIFIIYSYQLIPAETDLLFTVARVVFSEKTGIYFRNISPETRSSGRDNH